MSFSVSQRAKALVDSTKFFIAGLFLQVYCNASTFSPVTSPMGDTVYVADHPDGQLSGVTLSHCASQCMFYQSSRGGSLNCRCFNYDSKANNCNLFTSEPTSIAIDPNGFIGAYQYTDNPLTVASFPTVMRSECSLPYEFKGQRYTDCHYNNQPKSKGQGQLGCILPNGKPAYCTPQAYDNSNVALNKAAFAQSSHNLPASYATDGNYGTVTCTVTASVQPWWTVDLGQPYLVKEVDVAASLAYRLDNFLVKLSNVPPTAGQPWSDNTLCNQYSGSVPANGTARVLCSTALQSYRYVIVQGSLTTPQFLCLTEVIVIAIKPLFTPPYTMVTSKSCSFPFTYGGKLYYKCMQDVSPVTNANYPFACQLTGYKLATCLPPADYVATIENSTITVNGQPNQFTVSVFGWITFMWRKTEPTDGNWGLTLNDYVNGFGFRDGYLWLGLERVYQLTTNGNWMLRIEYYYNNKWVSAEYWSFTLGNGNNFYVINVDGYSGDDNDQFRAAGQNSDWNDNGKRFTINCSPHTGGWWFANCGVIFLTSDPPNITLDGGGTWPRIAEARMMMKAR